MLLTLLLTMKGLSAKFANLSRPGIARQLVKNADDSREHERPRPAAAPVAPKPTVVETPVVAAKAGIPSRIAKWRAANPELHRQRQAGYMRKRRAKPQNP